MLRREAKAAKTLVLREELRARRRVLRRLGYLTSEGLVTAKGAPAVLTRMQTTASGSPPSSCRWAAAHEQVDRAGCSSRVNIEAPCYTCGKGAVVPNAQAPWRRASSRRMSWC